MLARTFFFIRFRNLRESVSFDVKLFRQMTASKSHKNRNWSLCRRFVAFQKDFLISNFFFKMIGLSDLHSIDSSAFGVYFIDDWKQAQITNQANHVNRNEEKRKWWQLTRHCHRNKKVLFAGKSTQWQQTECSFAATANAKQWTNGTATKTRETSKLHASSVRKLFYLCFLFV